LVLVRPTGSSSAAFLPFGKDMVAQALQDVLANGLTQTSYAQLGVEIAGKPILILLKNL